MLHSKVQNRDDITVSDNWSIQSSLATLFLYKNKEDNPTADETNLQGFDPDDNVSTTIVSIYNDCLTLKILYNKMLQNEMLVKMRSFKMKSEMMMKLCKLSFSKKMKKKRKSLRKSIMFRKK